MLSNIPQPHLCSSGGGVGGLPGVGTGGITGGGTGEFLVYKGKL